LIAGGETSIVAKLRLTSDRDIFAQQYMINHNHIKTKMAMTEASGSLGPVFGPVEKCGAIKPIIGIHIRLCFLDLLTTKRI